MGTDRPSAWLRIEGLTKRYGGALALDDVRFEAAAGEVHALCGENGAGKSTLMRILAGATAADHGVIELEGERLDLKGPRDAEAAGIRMIHQELQLVGGLSASANIFLGRELRDRVGLLDHRGMHALARALLARLDARFDPRTIVEKLRVGDRQLVEIARTLTTRARVLIMDEPTSALSGPEIERLMGIIRDLAASGTTVLLSSHRMAEVFAVADHVTVLRDGRRVQSVRRDQTTPREVIRWMVGREITAPGRRHASDQGPALLEVEGLGTAFRSDQTRLHDISFALHRGEVLGVAGLLGAGKSELLHALFGSNGGFARGRVRLEGRPLRARHPIQGVKASLGLVPEDRKRQATVPSLSVADNISLTHLSALSRGGVIARDEERRAVRHVLERLRIKTPSSRAPITHLSGGNQQKCVLARWLLATPRVLLLDDPTRGIDVAAKAEIYELIGELAAHEGVGVLLTSSELPELLALCDRILVLCEGRLRATLTRPEATEERILEAATQFQKRPAHSDG